MYVRERKLIVVDSKSGEIANKVTS